VSGKIPKTIRNPEVASVFKAYPTKVRARLKKLRKLIYEVASANDEIGELEETLKWGEPSYLTPLTKSGSTVRIDWKKKDPDHYAIYFKCTTDLVKTFKRKYSGKIFNYSGNRAILFRIDDDIPENELKQCIALALTYHLNKKLSSKKRWEMISNIVDKE